MERNKGITLIALIITIIVMLILVAVSVQILIDSDLIGTAEKAAELYQAQTDEEANLSADSVWSDYLARAKGATNMCDHEYDENGICSGCGQEYVKFATTFGTIEVIWLDTNNKVIEEPLEPNLGDGMTKVAWTGTTEYTPSSNSEWYNYIAGTGTEDNTSSLWANAKTEDGSYWVWVPRYAYRITYYNGTDISIAQVSGYSDGRGIVDIDGNVQYELDEGIETVHYNGNSYIVHPTFMNNSSNNYENGGWDSDLSGIWVAKFEMSMETDGVTTTTSSSSIGNVLISDSVKAVSKPNVSSWRYIIVGYAYTNAYNYNRELESHLMKNSEWGAVAYLTHSQYGRNGNEITINSSSSFYTGGGDYSSNVTQSSTGNIYGIYDLSGGAWERIAAWNSASSSSSITSYAGTFASIGGSSTKYATSYVNENSTDSYSAISINDVGRTGDATKEVWNGSTVSSTAWFGDLALFAYSGEDILKRGSFASSGNRAGIFATGRTNGTANFHHGWRLVLILDNL